jgi:hypothetical protein
MTQASQDSPNHPLLGVELDGVHDVAKFNLGTKIESRDGTIYRYVLNDATAKSANLMYEVDPSTWTLVGAGETTTTAADAPKRVGWPQQSGGIAASKYAFVATGGRKFTISTSAAAAIDVELYTTATAGKVSSTATKLIQGLKLAVAAGSATTAEACSAIECYIPTDA